MYIKIRQYQEKDIPEMIHIWNEVVEYGNAFPQMRKLDEKKAMNFFSDQTYSAVAVVDNKVVGLYILHPNNIGRCAHIANASYSVDINYRGNGIGEMLVQDSLITGGKYGFRLLQFNAVVSSNNAAIHIYEKIGFHKVGIIPNGFNLDDEKYEDIIIYYIEL